MERITYIASRTDIAAMNMALFLEDKLSIKFIEGESIYTDQEIDTDLIVYLSRHKAKSGKPSLTVHPIGNYGKADFGGKDHTLVDTNSLALKQSLVSIHRHAMEMNLTEKFEITVEVTHHGPTNNAQTLFIEVGSSKKEWANLEACECIARAVLDINKYSKLKSTSAIYFGGTHYSIKATKIMLDEEGSDIAIGHMCPRYAQKWLDNLILEQMINKTHPMPKIAVIDKKGTSKKGELKKKLKDIGLEILLV